MNHNTLNVEEVVQALRQLGEEADWEDIKNRVTQNRGGGFDPYLNWMNYHTTMFQLIQQHCHGYKKFRGVTRFEKVGKGRFRLTVESRNRKP